MTFAQRTPTQNPQVAVCMQGFFNKLPRQANSDPGSYSA
jgi:hypothetical protein